MGTKGATSRSPTASSRDRTDDPPQQSFIPCIWHIILPPEPDSVPGQSRNNSCPTATRPLPECEGSCASLAIAHLKSLSMMTSTGSLRRATPPCPGPSPPAGLGPPAAASPLEPSIVVSSVVMHRNPQQNKMDRHACALSVGRWPANLDFVLFPSLMIRQNYITENIRNPEESYAPASP